MERAQETSSLSECAFFEGDTSPLTNMEIMNNLARAVPGPFLGLLPRSVWLSKLCGASFDLPHYPCPPDPFPPSPHTWDMPSTKKAIFTKQFTPCQPSTRGNGKGVCRILTSQNITQHNGQHKRQQGTPEQLLQKKTGQN